MGRVCFSMLYIFHVHLKNMLFLPLCEVYIFLLVSCWWLCCLNFLWPYILSISGRSKMSCWIDLALRCCQLFCCLLYILKAFFVEFQTQLLENVFLYSTTFLKCWYFILALSQCMYFFMTHLRFWVTHETICPLPPFLTPSDSSSLFSSFPPSSSLSFFWFLRQSLLRSPGWP